MVNETTINTSATAATTASVTREEQAVILDYLEHGYPMDSGNFKTPIAQALGLKNLSLLELVPKKGVFLQPLEEVYIGEAKRDEIHHIKGRISIDRLTSTARNELPHALRKSIEKNEAPFIAFFNKAQPLTLRMHQLELLPGLGLKHRVEILKARQEKPFESFEDIKNRVKLLPDPKQLVVNRILDEMEGKKDKHRIFLGRV
ncbi:DUF655 domain-containing protein [Candidatus Woesearchaeota archaeon]|nr:DUF655 domain-containing protein [Candidatus Woesearchaeota archaeon]